MTVLEKELSWYIERLEKGEYFSFPGFSDSEWMCMIGVNLGSTSAAGQYHSKEIGAKLREAVKYKDENYLRAVPKIILGHPIGTYIKDYSRERFGKDEVFYERDMVTDDLAARAGLAPLIRQLRKMDVILVGNHKLSGVQHILNYKEFYGISSPNFHMEEGAAETLVKRILDAGKEAVYLFSCGMSDAPMIGELHGKIKNSFFVDCGSIWDAFVGIGAQRGWRQELYSDPKKWLDWLNQNLRDL